MDGKYKLFLNNEDVYLTIEEIQAFIDSNRIYAETRVYDEDIKAWTTLGEHNILKKYFANGNQMEMKSSKGSESDIRMVKCPECGKENAFYKVYCMHCKKYLEQQSNTSSVNEKIEKNIGALVTCPKCQKQFSNRADMCPKCGYIPVLQCIVCSKQISKDSKICPECGDPDPFASSAISDTKITSGASHKSPVSLSKSNSNITNFRSVDCQQIGNSLMRTLFSTEGRIARRDFWKYCVVFLWFPLIFLYLLAQIFPDSILLVFYFLFAIFAFWPSIALQVKRWHDRGKSALWLMLNFIPVIGTIWIIIELGFLRGFAGSNKYGNDPLADRLYIEKMTTK
ncbi:DUF805 domain-containing protein [Desulfofustis limnaeus]|nr:DUF805 domain-containing protein [Desulfofustis limnaeus]